MASKIGREERYFKVSLSAALSKEWDQIERGHDEHGHKAVDHAVHSESHPPPEYYVNMLSEDTGYSVPMDGIAGGMSTKVVHDVPVDENNPDVVNRTMTKPYHSRVRSTDRTWIKSPIRGWATMATKALFNAGDVGNLAEDVTIHEHKGTPVTVHTFANNFETVNKLHDEVSRLSSPIQRYPDPLQIYQVAVIDFLTGNVDRHSFNLMVGSEQQNGGHHPLLAIDHENNFQYHRSLSSIMGSDDEHTPERNIGGRESDKPYDYIHLSGGLHQADRAGYDNGWEDFHEWWSSNADAIKVAFETQASYIKNDRIRQHVIRNFELRFDIIQRWAGEDDSSNYSEINLFNKEFPYEAKLTEMELADPEVTDAIVDALPSDPVKAILMIGDVYDNRSVSIKHKLLSAYNKIIISLNSEQIVYLYDKALKEPEKKVEHLPLSTAILFHVLKSRDEGAAIALIRYENDGRPGKIPARLKKKLGEI